MLRKWEGRAEETYVSCDRPPWFDSPMPCTPCWKARIASSTHWMPLTTSGRAVVSRTQARSSQVTRGLITEPMVRAMPVTSCPALTPPFSSLVYNRLKSAFAQRAAGNTEKGGSGVLGSAP